MFCVIVEIRAAVRNAGMPARVPLAGGTQMLVHRLVTAALLLVTATAVLSPALAHHAAAPPPRPGRRDRLRGPACIARRPAGRGPRPTASSRPAAPIEKIYVVKPPVGRYHESLWEIAQNHLGDGRRYGEIFQLNKDRVQPDGSAHHRQPDPARLGAAHAAPTRTAPASSRDRRRDTARRTTSRARGTVPRPGRPAPPGPAGRAARTAEDGRQAARPRRRPGQRGRGRPADGRDHRVRPGAAPGRGPARPELPRRAGRGARCWPPGVLAALGRRRREQLWRRAFGARIAAAARPTRPSAEVALRLGAHEPSAGCSTPGLRLPGPSPSARRAAPRRPCSPPTSAPSNLDLWVPPPTRARPRPWTAVDDGQVWRLPARARLHRLDREPVAGALAPVPRAGLARHRQRRPGPGRPGGRARPDQPERARETVPPPCPPWPWSWPPTAGPTGCASPWSASARISPCSRPTGSPPCARLAEALPELEARAAEVADAMAMAGIGSVLTGRARGADPQTWAPHYLLMATPPIAAGAAAAARPWPRIRHAAAAGYVVAGDVPGAAWTWEIDGEGQLVASQLGFDVEAQLLPPQPARRAGRAVRAAPPAAGAPLTRGRQLACPPPSSCPAPRCPSRSPCSARSPCRRRASSSPTASPWSPSWSSTWPPTPAACTPTCWPAPSGRGACQPRSATPRSPGSPSGSASTGHRPPATWTPTPAGRLRLGPGVRVDWQVFRALAGLAAQARDPGREDGYLARALGLVDGQLLDRPGPGRYAWLAADDLEYEVTARVADAAHRLAAAAARPRRRRRRHGRRPGPACGWPSPTSCCGATCCWPPTPPATSTCSARWWTRCAPGPRWTRCCPGWPRRPRR